MEDLEPELSIYEEHYLCRESNYIQFLLSKMQIHYHKVTIGTSIYINRGVSYRTPCVFLGEVYMGGLRVLLSFLKDTEDNRYQKFL